MTSRGKTPGGDRPPPGARRKPPAADAATEAERALGLRLRAVYVAHRSAYESFKAGTTVRWAVPARYDGVARSSVDPQDAGKRVKNVWYEMARWFLARKIDGAAFVQYVFTRLHPGHRAPEPAQVCSDAYVAGFKEFNQVGKPELVAAALEVQIRTARSSVRDVADMWGALDPAEAVGKRWVAVQTVLLDRDKPLTALFRYILARSSAADAAKAGDDEDKYRFLEIAAQFFDRAVVQFQSCREAYLEHWRRWLPKDFATAADERYSLLVHNQETGSEDEALRRQG